MQSSFLDDQSWSFGMVDWVPGTLTWTICMPEQRASLCACALCDALAGGFALGRFAGHVYLHTVLVL